MSAMSHANTPKDAKRKKRSQRGGDVASPAEKGKPASDSNGPESSTADQYPNYEYRGSRRILLYLVLTFETTALALLAVIIFAEPYVLSGSSSILRDVTNGEFVGVLRRCGANTCDGWMVGTASDSTSTSVTRDISPRADTGFDYTQMFLTTGLATLAAFWMTLYTTLMSLCRFCWWSKSPAGHTGSHFFKRLLYRGSSAFLVVLAVLLPSICLDAIVKSGGYRAAKSLSGSDGIGAGIALLICAALSIILAALIETRQPSGRTQRMFMRLDCCGMVKDEDSGDVAKAPRTTAGKRR